MHVVAFKLTYYYPFLMAVLFLVCLRMTKIPDKVGFFWRVVVALTLAVLFAHANRLFDLWPAHRSFASGHMTFSFGVSLLLGKLRPWTLAFTLPLLVPFGIALVKLHFHTPTDVLGAFPLVLGVFAAVQALWPWPVISPPLDSRARSI